ncbi:MAG: class I SAM-dependent methyltransferase [Betaproteobacteria bacterium]
MSKKDSISQGYDLAAPWYDAWTWQTFWNRNEVPLVRASIARFAGARKSIDIGTGTGRYVSLLRQEGQCAYGVDSSKEMLSIAASKLNGNEQLVHADARSQIFSTAYFDLAIAARMLCHVLDLESSFREIARIVTSGGGLIVTELDHGHSFDKTRVPTPKGKIAIRTWKRNVNDLVQIAERVGWRIDELKRISARECSWLPERGKLSSINRSTSQPIFNVITLRRV